MLSAARPLRRTRWLLALLAAAVTAGAQEPSEYRLKAAFLYNFVLFTEWPAEVGGTINLCIYGHDPFGPEIEVLQGKTVSGRRIVVLRRPVNSAIKSCQVVFIASSAIPALPRVLEEVRDSPVLTVADSPGAARQGVALNMAVTQDKITFEANLQAARAARLNLSSKLMRLATEVQQ